jgi:hypothetical protein
MELKFVEDNIVEMLTGRGRRGQNLPWSEFIEELYKHPERWAEFPHKVNSSATAYVHIEKFQNIEVRLTGGNNLATARLLNASPYRAISHPYRPPGSTS